MIDQIECVLSAKSRGYHLVTREIMAALPSLPEQGLLHLFLLHTSAAITINENADASVRIDFESIFNRLVPEDQPYYTHTIEGSDDMPAHIKAAMIGHSITVPIRDHQLVLGTWQGIYFCEFRNHAGPRRIMATIYS